MLCFYFIYKTAEKKKETVTIHFCRHAAEKYLLYLLETILIIYFAYLSGIIIGFHVKSCEAKQCNTYVMSMLFITAVATSLYL